MRERRRRDILFVVVGVDSLVWVGNVEVEVWYLRIGCGCAVIPAIVVRVLD